MPDRLLLSRLGAAFAISLCALPLSQLLPSPCSAEEWLPEFESLSEEEQARMDGPDRLSSEYASDTLTYQKPDDWEYRWLTRDRVFDLSTGSLDASHFLMDNRLKIRVPLNDHFDFRFLYVDNRDFDLQSTHHVLELTGRPFSWLGLSLYGEPDHYKRKDNTGIAAVFHPAPRHEIRVFNTFVYVTLLKRNDRSDRFIEPYLPYSRGVVGRVWADPESGESSFLEYALRRDTETKWYFPDQQLLYGYERSFASLRGRWAVAPARHLSAKLLWDRKLESRAPWTDGAPVTASITQQSWTTTRMAVQLRSTFDRIGPRNDWQVSTGVLFSGRNWDTNQGLATYRDWIPHFSLKLPAFGKEPYADHWSIGAMTTFHGSSGPAALFTTSEKSSAIEWRFNLSYEFVFRDRMIVRLTATGDLDEYGEHGSWEGGNGQLILFF